MKRALTLLAVTMLTANSVGCNCCPCLRNCVRSGPVRRTGAPPVPTYAAVPARLRRHRCTRRPPCTPRRSSTRCPSMRCRNRMRVGCSPSQRVYMRRPAAARPTPRRDGLRHVVHVAEPGCGYIRRRLRHAVATDDD